MRKRKIQSISLKLSELKEYDLIKQEKMNTQSDKQKNSGSGAGAGGVFDASAGPSPISKAAGPKPQQEIRQRIGLTAFQ